MPKRTIRLLEQSRHVDILSRAGQLGVKVTPSHVRDWDRLEVWLDDFERSGRIDPRPRCVGDWPGRSESERWRWLWMGRASFITIQHEATWGVEDYRRDWREVYLPLVEDVKFTRGEINGYGPWTVGPPRRVDPTPAPQSDGEVTP